MNTNLANWKTRLTVAATMAAFAAMSLAQGEGGEADFSTTITQFKTDITTMLTTYGPLVVGIMVTVLGWRFVIRWIRSLGRSV